MANTVDFSDWANFDVSAIADKLNQVGIDEILGALTEEAEHTMTVSKSRVPVADGTLLASADEVGINVDRDANSGTVAFGYGGLAAAYSIVQHETPPPGVDPDPDYDTPRRYRHNPGQSWKYLERPVLESAAGLESRIAGRLDIEGQF